MSRFTLYQGLVKYIQDSGSDSSGYQVTLLPIDKFETHLMQIFNCEQGWPVCLFDFAFKNKNPTYLAYRTQSPLTSYMVDNYFYGPKCNRVVCDELVIERNHHLCGFQNFVENFKLRYQARDDLLLLNPCLKMFLKDDKDLDSVQMEFVR